MGIIQTLLQCYRTPYSVFDEGKKICTYIYVYICLIDSLNQTFKIMLCWLTRSNRYMFILIYYTCPYSKFFHILDLRPEFDTVNTISSHVPYSVILVQ